MNFNELQQIVRHLKKTMECANCKKKYLYDDFEVLSTYDGQGIFSANCFHCQNQIVIHVSIGDKKKGKKGEKNNTETLQTEQITEREHGNIKKRTQITSNDVIDLHVFLENFNGDFKTLFSNKKP